MLERHFAAPVAPTTERRGGDRDRSRESLAWDRYVGFGIALGAVVQGLVGVPQLGRCGQSEGLVDAADPTCTCSAESPQISAYE